MRKTNRVTVIQPNSLQRGIGLAVAGTVALLLICGQGALQQAGNAIPAQVLEQLLNTTVPTLGQQGSFLRGASKLLLGFDFDRPVTLFYGKLAFAAPAQPAPASATTPSPPPGDAAQIKEITINPTGGGGSMAAEGVRINNNTTYDFDAGKLLNEKLDFKIDQKGPQILIVQSHASEAYMASDRNYYLPTDPDRTEDINYNVVRVGGELTKTLKGMGYDVIHDEKLHDYPSYNGSYKSSLATVEDYLAQYPSIRIVIDVHRDSMVQADGTKLKVTADIKGKKAAQVMIVTGTNQGGLNHPDWIENLKFSMKVQRRVNLLYPGLMRPINLAKERYNTHTTHASIILEVGSSGNTLEEALYGATLVGNALGDMLKYVK